jgi:PAS domain-containing protein
MFERLTGYTPSEVIGKNCRFLQAPDGRVAIGSRRKYTDNTTVYHIKTHMVQGKESQSSIINYQKTGQVNH